MKRDLAELETDPPGLPPYITRSTDVPVRPLSTNEGIKLHQIMAKFEQNLAQVFGGAK
jgi:hypothetical protein